MPAKPSPEEFLATFPPEIQVLANELRALVKETVPKVKEAVYTGFQVLLLVFPAFFFWLFLYPK